MQSPRGQPRKTLGCRNNCLDMHVLIYSRRHLDSRSAAFTETASPAMNSKLRYWDPFGPHLGSQKDPKIDQKLSKKVTWEPPGRQVSRDIDFGSILVPIREPFGHPVAPLLAPKRMHNRSLFPIRFSNAFWEPFRVPLAR